MCPYTRPVTSRVDIAAAMRTAQLADPASVAVVMTLAARDIGGSDVVLYLVDFEQLVLEPLRGTQAHADLPGTEEVATTMAGRSFLSGSTVTAPRPDGTRVWVPIVEGSDRTGVLAMTLPRADQAVIAECSDLGMLAGYLIAAHTRCTDLYQMHRRRRSMSLAASMQWDLLPPLVLRTPTCTVAARLEPAYEVGGDCFDYSINGPVLDMAIVDSMGHGVTSSSIASLAIGCYRHGRREGRSLAYLHESLNEVIERQFNREAFATGQIGQLDLQGGMLTWVNAGHPRPLLVRGGQVIKQLEAAPCLPWGLGSSPLEIDHEIAQERLEPGDGILFFTDGIVDARTKGSGEDFGLERLADITAQCASTQLRPEEIVRKILEGVLNHQASVLRYDATAMYIEWNGGELRGRTSE
jgi:serine phosphatase RsbU (regulator of sigma subunit)